MVSGFRPWGPPPAGQGPPAGAGPAPRDQEPQRPTKRLCTPGPTDTGPTEPSHSEADGCYVTGHLEIQVAVSPKSVEARPAVLLPVVCRPASRAAAGGARPVPGRRRRTPLNSSAAQFQSRRPARPRGRSGRCPRIHQGRPPGSRSSRPSGGRVVRRSPAHSKPHDATEPGRRASGRR